MAVDITSSFSSASSIQRLVDLYVQREEGPKNRKTSELASIRKKKSVLSELQSKLSSLNSKSSVLSDTVFNIFENKIASSSDSDKIKASASDSSIAGNHSLSVTRLATAHTIVSDQYTASSTSISSHDASTGKASTIMSLVFTRVKNSIHLCCTSSDLFLA